MSKYIPFNITTDAGKELWREMNQHYGSVVWGRVGDGIEAVEAEMRERIIKLLQEAKSELEGHDSAECKCRDYAKAYGWAIRDIKGEEQ